MMKREKRRTQNRMVCERRTTEEDDGFARFQDPRVNEGVEDGKD